MFNYPELFLHPVYFEKEENRNVSSSKGEKGAEEVLNCSSFLESKFLILDSNLL